MNTDNRTMQDPAKRAEDLRRRHSDSEKTASQDEENDEVEPAEQVHPCFSLVSADRMRKVSLILHFVNLDAQALVYSYLVRTRWKRSTAIEMDFGGYAVEIQGRNLKPIFDGLASQRLATIREIDELQARANLPEKTTVVTKITVTEDK